MSDNFDNKDYGSYFESLEKQLNNPTPKRQAVRKAPVPLKNKKKKRIYKIFRIRKSVIAVFLAAVIMIAVVRIVDSGIHKPKTSDIKSDKKSQTAAGETKEEKPLNISFEEDENTKKIPSSNDAAAAVVINKTTGKIVAARNPDKQVFPASTTKVMTLLVAVEHIEDFSDTYTMSYEITDPLYRAEASVAGFSDGEEVTMTDLLYGMILPSGADGAIGLANKIAGSEKAFVELMNQKVEELKLKNTHFDNVSGLHSSKNYSSAYDMAVILAAAMENETCKRVLSTYQYTTRKTDKHPKGIELSSTLFSYMYGTEPETATILGGKTGFVDEADYCIVSFGENNQNGTEYIVATMGNSSRWPAFYGQIDLYKEFAK